MKRQFWIFALLLLGFAYFINNTAISDTGYKVAVVDVQSIIAKSSQVTALKNKQEKELNAMKTTVDKARMEISKETDPKKIEQLEEKYRTTINQQKIALDTEYNNKLKQIDKEIKGVIISKAKEMKYDLVLPKSIVLFGGDDITDAISKQIK